MTTGAVTADRELVHLDIARGIATLTLDSAHNRNALSRRLRNDLRAHLETALRSADVRVLVLAHAGPIFCSGADLKETRKGTGDNQLPGDDWIAVLDLLCTSPKPAVARLAGPARAGGLGLMAACDFAIAVDTATFAFPEVRLGVVPAVISVPLRTRVLPHALHRLMLTGESFDAAHAVDIGLLTRAVPIDRLDDEVRRLTDALSLGAPGALAATKRILTADKRSLSDDLAEMQALSTRHFDSAEGQEGIRAFAEKRRPSWVPSVG